MRKTILFGKDVYLTEKHWSVLVGRFDLEKAKKNKYGTRFAISIGCFCCDFPCSRCSLRVLRWGDLYGCIRAVYHLCGTSNLAFDVGMYGITWWEGDDKRARRQIQKVYTALMCMEQVKR